MHCNKETKFSQMIKGVAVLLMIKSLLELSNLKILKNLEDLTICSPVFVVVVFQPEIRRCLQYLGRGTHIKQKRSTDEEIFLSLKKALQYMSKRRIGALITLERNMDLDEFIGTGTRLNADITGELIINLFTPNAPLHDGAVILRSSKIIAAGTYLPLTKSERVPNKYGTRHRAALGMSEVNDSITVVVSEETGEVGIAYEGVFLDHLTTDMCLEVVRREMSWM